MPQRVTNMPTEDTDYTCRVVRVTAPDTVMVRVNVPPLMGSTTIYLRLFGVDCEAEAKRGIVDWVELYQGGIELLVLDWLRDPYGRVLGDLSNGEEGVTDYLQRVGLATPRPNHHTEAVADLLNSEEPEE